MQTIPLDDEQQEQHRRRQQEAFLTEQAQRSDDQPPAQESPSVLNQEGRLSNASDSSANSEPLKDPQFREHDVRNQTIMRVLFSATFLLLSFYTMFDVDQIQMVSAEQCMRDLTFELTDKANKFLLENVDFRNKYIAFSSFLMDLMILSFMMMFYKYWKSYRIVLAYGLFFGCRTFLQKNFFMGRLEGFAYFDPGIYSLTVPYHDVNDFFYSGHVGTCLLITLEYYAGGFKKLSLFTAGVLINQWTMLYLVRTHYIIDLITGLLFAHYFFIQAEKISYLTDVIGMGIGNGKRRFRYFWQPCSHCGWATKGARDYIQTDEKLILKSMLQERRSLIKTAPSVKGKAISPKEKKGQYVKHFDDV